ATLKATLASVNLKKAEEMPGVTVVRDGDFIAVAAPNERLAEEALSAIQAEWKSPPQPSDRDLFDALKQPASGGHGQARRANPIQGSVAKGLAEADHKLEAVYTIAYIAHAPMEPRAAVAQWQDGKLTVWTGTQRPFGVRSDLARAFGLAQDRIRVIVPDMG